MSWHRNKGWESFACTHPKSFDTIVLTQMFCDMAVEKKIEFPQNQQLQHRQMHSRGRVGVFLRKVNDFLIDSHSICGWMEANVDGKTFQQIIRILPEAIFALLTQGARSRHNCWQLHWGLPKHLDLQAIFYLQKNQIIRLLQIHVSYMHPDTSGMGWSWEINRSCVLQGRWAG